MGLGGSPFTSSSSGGSKSSGLLTGLGAVLGGPVGGLVGSVVSNIFGNRGAKRREQQAREWNLKQWHRQNEYNLPVNQMKRLQEAGLNPNLIYGSGSANTGIAGSVAPGKAAPYNVKDPTPSALSTAMITSQIKNLDSITNKNNADTAKTLGVTPSLIEQNKQKAKKSTEEAIQAAVRTGEITKQQKATTQSLMSKAKLDVLNLGYQRAYLKFKNSLISKGIDPQGGLHTTLLKWFSSFFNSEKDQQDWLNNPNEPKG